jgi:predicted dehydrogenase
MSETYKVAFVGTGGISRAHAAYYVANPATQIVAACDIDPEKLRGFREQFDVPQGYADYRELLEKEQPDIVSVCTWHGTHSEITVAAAEAGVKAILAEKPMGRDLREAGAMVEAADAHGVKLAIHHQLRFAASYCAVRKAIGEGAIGNPISLFWRTGGGMLNNGCHGVDLFRWMLGDPAWTGIMGQVERKSNRYERGLPAEDRACGVIRFEGKHELVLEVDMLGEERAESSYRLTGSEGMIQCDGHHATLLTPDQKGWQELELLPQPTPLPTGLANGSKISYRVLPGDSLGFIAGKFNTTPEAIVAANKTVLTDGTASVIYPGWVLQVPINLVTPVPTKAPTKTLTPLFSPTP